MQTFIMGRHMDLLGSLTNPILSFAESLEAIRGGRRISVIGKSGSGKSALAQAIAVAIDAPHYPMDREVLWTPGWNLRSKQERRELSSKLIAEDRWVLDGTSVDIFDIRLPRTDVLVWPNLPRTEALFNICHRVYKLFGKVRQDMADGCPEKLPDRDFMSYIWNFEKVQIPKVCAGIVKFGPEVPIVWLPSRSEVDCLIDNLPNSEY